MLCNKSFQDKLEKINERALRLAYADCTSSYEILLTKCNEAGIHIQSIRLLALEIYKTLNNLNLNPVFMRDYFTAKRVNHDLRKRNPLQIPKVRATA